MSDANEVAEDYRLALEDLSSNMRFEISNLTVIARENTEHALTIADVLQQHILKVKTSRAAKPMSLLKLTNKFRNVANTATGCTVEETTCSICPRFDCQKCRHSLYPLFRPKPLQNLYGILRRS